jgi:LysR family transcriptional regulator for metE and metH
MIPFLDSRHLRLVAEVGRTESVTRAADRLNVTQSAVSHQIRDIESRLGTPVFVRSGRRMLLTPAGRLIAAAAETVQGEIDRVEARVAQLARHAAGELRVCTHCYTGYHWLPPLVQGLRERYPDFHVQVAVEHTLDPIGALLDAKLDVALMNEASDDPRLEYRELFDDEHVAVVPASHRWAAQPFVTLDALATEPLYLYSRSLEHSFTVQKLLRPAGIEPGRITYLQLTEGIIEMVKAGLGASVLPKWSITHVLATKAVSAVRITKAGVYRKWYAVKLRGSAPTPFLRDFVRLLIKQGPAAKRATHPRLAS